MQNIEVKDNCVKIHFKDIPLSYINSIRTSILNCDTCYAFYNIGISKCKVTNVSEETVCDLIRNVPVSNKCIAYININETDKKLSSNNFFLFEPLDIDTTDIKKLMIKHDTYDIVIYYDVKDSEYGVVINDPGLHNIKHPMELRQKILDYLNKTNYSHDSDKALKIEKEKNNDPVVFTNNKNSEDFENIIHRDITLLNFEHSKDYHIKMVVTSRLGLGKKDPKFSSISVCSVYQESSYEDVVLEYELRSKIYDKIQPLKKALTDNIDIYTNILNSI